MKLKTIAATYGRKMNLGDYNSVHSEITLWADLEDGDDEAASADALRQMARNHVMTELARVQPQLAAKVQDIYMGLPVAVQEKIQSIDENGIPYTTNAEGVRQYRGDNARRAIENDLKELDRKHGGY